MLVQGRLLIDPGEVPQPGYIVVEGERISEVGTGDPPDKADLGDAETIITPGFIDAHMHFPQIDSIGCDGLTLLDWLNSVVFPAEARWSDADFALQHSREAVRRMFRQGTTGCAAFLTSHETAMPAAAAALRDVPLRAIVGRVMMDRNAPAELLQQPDDSFFDAPSDRPARMTVSVNPRFAISCSEEALACAGRNATDRYVHTHLAEMPAEIELTARLFPRDPDYTSVYDRFGLLQEKTLLAHCVHLSDREWALIASRGCTVVHCPQANIFLESGLFNMGKALDYAVPVALGSDVAGGCDFAMPRVARSMIETAKVCRLTLDPKAHVPTPVQAWRMITRGNAEALGWSDSGVIRAGAYADLLFLRPPFTLDEHYIGRLIYTWSEDYIAARILAGRVYDPGAS